MKKIFAVLVFLSLANSGAFAQAQLPEFNPQVKRVAVFKNGYAFTYREGEARPVNGWAYTTNAPTGVIGAVWGYTTSPNARVVQMLASEVEKKQIKRVESLAEVLFANQGAPVRIKTNRDDKILQGVYQIISAGAENLTIALKTETGTLFLPFGMVETIEVVGQPKLEKSVSTQENRLSIKTEGARDNQNVTLGIAALERGIRWIPAYRVEVKGEPVREAKIELEAMLINELVDLSDSEVYFVVGVPHFLFQDTISPLSLNRTFAGVSDYFQRGPGGGRSNAFSNAIMTQQARMSEDLTNAQSDGLPTVSEEEQTASFSAEQLYLYQAKQISLKKGERSSLRLFSLTVPATEVFEWTISDSPAAANLYLSSAGYSVTQPSTTELTNRVWYALRLKNTTGMPWTTAPALSFREWKPLGQDMLSFTPTGGENILRVTPATEVLGTQRLEEKGRERQQLRYGGGTYEFDLVTVEGTIKLRNVKKQPVEMVLTRNLVGEVLSASDDGKITREGLNLQAVNPNSTVKWNLTLPPGEKEIRYTYRVFVRR